jgi:putative DNA primase/helicase
VEQVMKNFVTSYRPAKAAITKTDIELASEVHDLIGHDCVICDPTEVVYFWDNEQPRSSWQRLHDPELRNIVRAKLLAFTNKPTVTLVNNVTKAIKDMAYQRDPKMNLGGNEIVSFQNGDVQLLQGKWHLADTLLEHRRITRIPHCYDPTATAPMFCEFLDQTFEGDHDALDKQQLILQMMGYSLQTHARHEKGIMTVGVGGNGKSVLDSVVKGMVGHDNFAAVQPNNLDNNFQKATMRYKLINAITESEQSSKLPTGHVKAIISGEAMTVENKRKDPFVMHPFCTLWWATNHLPQANDYSEAIYRRIFIVEFNNTVPPEKRDTKLADKLVQQEMPGIIKMALDAYAEAVRSGFALPDSVTEARKTWRIKSDSVAGWFNDCVEVMMLDEMEIPARRAYEHYAAWCKAGGYSAVSETSFSDRMTKLKHPSVKKSRGMVYPRMRIVQGMQGF